ncbi:MAG: glycosyltransferase [Candidatus Chisholmbacteria bacterium]|nr:glycosyltransferase [Candidatus Chisholmbacteria bacterium]
MTVCFFGYPNESYSRSKILIDGLKKNGVQVVSCTDKTGSFPFRYWRLVKKFWPLHQKIDVIFVQFPGHLNTPIAWFLGKVFKKIVVFDVFISLYETYIFDRQVASPQSLTAKFYWWVDKLSCLLADKVTLDTYAHINYFVTEFHLPRKKFVRIPVGGDETLFRPSLKAKSSKLKAKIIVEFHGMFTRIHGAEVFVQAAKKLENNPHLEFWLIGDSPNYRLPIDLYKQLKPKTMKYWSRLPVKKLAQKISQADISVGHLGPTKKARVLLTNKMFHALASRLALIAGDNQASQELLENKTNCLFVRMYDEKDLARKIIYLAKNSKLRHRLAESGFKLHQKEFSNRKLGSLFKELLLKTV